MKSRYTTWALTMALCFGAVGHAAALETPYVDDGVQVDVAPSHAVNSPSQNASAKNDLLQPLQEATAAADSSPAKTSQPSNATPSPANADAKSANSTPANNSPANTSTQNTSADSDHVPSLEETLNAMIARRKAWEQQHPELNQQIAQTSKPQNTQAQTSPPPQQNVQNAQQNAQAVKNAQAPRFQEILRDASYVYYMDTQEARYINAPGTQRRVIDVWIKMVTPNVAATMNPDSTDGTYYLEHYYIDPNSKQIQFLCELEVTGRPSNTAAQRAYSEGNWENLVPESVEDVIYHAVTKKMRQMTRFGGRGSFPSLNQMLDDYLHISL